MSGGSHATQDVGTGELKLEKATSVSHGVRARFLFKVAVAAEAIEIQMMILKGCSTLSKTKEKRTTVKTENC